MSKAKTFIKYTLIIGLALAVIGFIVLLFVFRKADDTVAKQKTDYSVQSKQLVTDFENNENTANAKYLGKILEIEGPVAEITVDSNAVVVVLRPEGAMSGVNCALGKSQVADTSKISIGKTVKIKGVCNGYLMDVVVNKASLVK
ncbi:MAG TPA: hypothetical protein PK252_01640 [Bacteroidales bacterium]|nr:hypothetical protein [Bacteroidales bacterium]